MKKRIKHLNTSLQHKMKNKFFILGFLVFLFSSIIFVSGDEAGDMTSYSESADISGIVGADEGFLFVEKVNYEKVNGMSKLTFQPTEYDVPNGRIKIGDNDFTNIASSKNGESYLKVDGSGNIIEANLRIVKGNQDVIIDGKSFTAPPGSTINYKDGKLKITLPSGTAASQGFSFKDWGTSTNDVILEGKNFVVFDETGKKIVFGYADKVHYDGKNYFFEAGESLKYEGVSFTPKEKLNIYFDGKVHEGTAISFGDTSFSLSCGSNPDIGELTLSGNSKYYKLKDINGVYYSKSSGFYNPDRLEERTYGNRDLTISFTEPNSNIDFFGQTNPLDPNIPTITCSGGYIVETGKVGLVSEGGRVKYVRNSEGGLSSREVIITDNSNEEYQKFIQIGENSNMRVGVHSTSVPWTAETSKALNMFNVYLFSENPELFGTYDFGNDYDLQEKFVKQKTYVAQAQSILNDELVKKYPDLNTYEQVAGKIKVTEISDFVSEIGTDYYLTKSEMTKALAGTGYENYALVVDNLKEMIPYYDTSGTIEGQVSSTEELYGVRQWLIHRYLKSNEEDLNRKYLESKSKVYVNGRDTVNFKVTTNAGN